MSVNNSVSLATASAYAFAMLAGKTSIQEIDIKEMDNVSTQIVMEAESVRVAEASAQLKQITKTLSNGLATVTKWYAKLDNALHPQKAKRHKHKKLSTEETLKEWRETLNQVDKLTSLDLKTVRQTGLVIIKQNDDDENGPLAKIAFAKDDPSQITDLGTASYTSK